MVQINILLQFICTAEILCRVCVLYGFDFSLSKVVLCIYFGANNTVWLYSTCVTLSGSIFQMECFFARNLAPF